MDRFWSLRAQDLARQSPQVWPKRSILPNWTGGTWCNDCWDRLQKGTHHMPDPNYEHPVEILGGAEIESPFAHPQVASCSADLHIAVVKPARTIPKYRESL